MMMFEVNKKERCIAALRCDAGMRGAVAPPLVAGL
jgi:hypothetical protein